MVQITLQLPEDIASHLVREWKDLPRAALESLAGGSVSRRILTASEVQRLLGYDTAYALDGFLKHFGVFWNTHLKNSIREAENSRRLWDKRPRENVDDGQRRAG